MFPLGTARFLVSPTSMSNPQPALPNLELHLTSLATTRAVFHLLTGRVQLREHTSAASDLAFLGPPWEGASVRIRSLITGLAEEAFLDVSGSFAQEMELQPDADNPLELTVCNGVGREVARLVTHVQHQEKVLEASEEQDQPKAVLQQVETSELPWQRFTQLVRHCLDVAAAVARSSSRDPEELFGYIHAQDRYAEQAHAERNQALYRECCENLAKYAGYLEGLLHHSRPRPVAAPALPPEEEARVEVERFRNNLSSVWKQVRAERRNDLEPRLAEIARQAGGLTQRIKQEPLAVVHEARRLGREVARIAEEYRKGRSPTPGDDTGLLEGSSEVR